MVAQALKDVVAAHRVVVCLGSGGVGKTTTSAALALRAALDGKRALCLTIDPARRLANSLGLKELRGQEQAIDQSLFAEQGLACRGSLSAMMLDMKHTFDELVTRYAGSDEQRERIMGNRIYQYVSTSLAGTQEYMAMEKLHAVRQDPRFDTIVLDTPPTTNALDFLDAPQKLVGAIDSPVMRWFVEQLGGGAGFLGRGAAFVLRGLSRFTGAEFLQLVAQFVTDLNALFGGFRQRAQAVYDDLRGPDVAFVIVTSPSPLAVSEALFFSKKLADYGIQPAAVIVNRVNVAPSLATGLEAGELARLAPDLPDPDGLLTRMRQAAADQVALARRDREGVRRLRDHIGDRLSYTEVPAFDQDVHDLRSLARVGEYLLGASPGGETAPLVSGTS
jgi:anion-transporting  ArsA/GET3 family ATPase